MTIALAYRHPEGVILATDGLWGRRPNVAGAPFDYLTETKIGWFPGYRAACAPVGGVQTRSPDEWPLARFGLLDRPDGGADGNPFRFRPTMDAVYERLARSYEAHLADNRETWPERYADMDPSWYDLTMLAISYLDDGPRIFRFKRTRTEMEIGEVIAVGAWEADPDAKMRSGALPHLATDIAGARAVVGDLLVRYVESYRNGPAAEERLAKNLPLAVGLPIYSATITKDRVELGEFK